MISRRNLIGGLAIAPAAAIGLGAWRAEGAMTSSLDQLAAPSGRYFGAAVRFDQLHASPALKRVLLADCGSVTPEIHMKWDALQPAPDTWNTGPADDLVAFARSAGLKVRGHTLLWDQSTPRWARERIIAHRDWSLVDGFIGDVMTRYGRDVDEWDVVNEPIDVGHRSDGLRATTFLKAFGPDYVRRALDSARAAAPRARLMINDYGFDYENSVEAARRTAFLRLLECLKSSGAPLDGVGVQAHLDLGKGPLRRETLAPFFQAIADMGLSIAVTELDVRENDVSLSLNERDGRVADEVRRYLEIALDNPAVRGVTTWGLRDTDSWLQDPAASPAALNRGLPYDLNLAPKPMHRAIAETLGRPV